MADRFLPPLDATQRYTMAEACAYLRQSKAKSYADIKQGHLEVFKDGNRTYVNGMELIRRSRPQ